MKGFVMFFQFSPNVSRRVLNTAKGEMVVYEQRGYCFAPGAEYPMPFDVRVDDANGFKPKPAFYVATAESLVMGEYGSLQFARGMNLRQADEDTVKWFRACPVKD
jgi:hypothetical protein